MSKTPYVETEALLAVMEGDVERAAGILDDMLPGELVTFSRQVADLAVAIIKARTRKLGGARVPRPRQ